MLPISFFRRMFICSKQIDVESVNSIRSTYIAKHHDLGHIHILVASWFGERRRERANAWNRIFWDCLNEERTIENCVSCLFRVFSSLCSVVVAVAASGTSHYLQNLLRYVSFEKLEDVSRVHYPILTKSRAQFRSMHNAHNQIITTKTPKNVVWRAKRKKKEKQTHPHRSWAMLMVIVSIQSASKYHFVLFGIKK